MTYRMKLVEVALPLDAINEWRARRPRAVSHVGRIAGGGLPEERA